MNRENLISKDSKYDQRLISKIMLLHRIKSLNPCLVIKCSSLSRSILSKSSKIMQSSKKQQINESHMLMDHINHSYPAIKFLLPMVQAQTDIKANLSDNRKTINPWIIKYLFNLSRLTLLQQINSKWCNTTRISSKSTMRNYPEKYHQSKQDTKTG